MMNVFSTKKKIHLRFDLKGSKLGRRVLKQKEIAKQKRIKHEINKHKYMII